MRTGAISNISQHMRIPQWQLHKILGCQQNIASAVSKIVFNCHQIVDDSEKKLSIFVYCSGRVLVLLKYCC